MDFGLDSMPKSEDRFSISPLLVDSFVALVPLGHPLSGRSWVSLRDLVPYPFIAMKSSYGVKLALDKALRDLRITLQIEQELVHHYSLGQLIKAGLGVSAIPKLTLPLVNTSGLIAIPISDPSVQQQMHIIRRRGSQLSRRCEQFLSRIISNTHNPSREIVSDCAPVR